jgi:uncharacterized protein YqeY
MTLNDRINEDLKAAMKAREELKLSVLRMAKAAAGNAAIAKGKDALDDAEMIEVFQKMAKQRQESIDAFTKAGRTDMAEKEAKEAEILKAYMPAAMPEEELKAIIQAAIKETGASGPAGVGQVMKVVLPKVKGRADGKQVNQLVAQLLQ